MIAIEAVRVTVYRSNTSRKKRFSKLSAYKDAAWKAWQAAYYPGCMCRREEPQVDDEDFFCPEHAGESHPFASDVRRSRRNLTVLRIVRWLLWRDEQTIPRQLTQDLERARENLEFYKADYERAIGREKQAC